MTVIAVLVLIAYTLRTPKKFDGMSLCDWDILVGEGCIPNRKTNIVTLHKEEVETSPKSMLH